MNFHFRWPTFGIHVSMPFAGAENDSRGGMSVIEIGQPNALARGHDGISLLDHLWAGQSFPQAH
jgi:hypothetical protein